MLSKKRNSDYVIARHFLGYYLRKHTELTLKEVGSVTNSHHATVIHSVSSVNEWYLFDKTFRLYKESIDNKCLVKPLTLRGLINQIIRSQKSSNSKCDLIMELIKKENDESSRTIK